MGLLLALFAMTLATGPDLPKGFVGPAGWNAEGVALGDLNGDGRPDLAVVWHQAAAAGSDGPDPVKLQVYLQQADGSWKLHTTAEKAVCCQCGGAKGPPVEGDPAITPKGILQVSYSGGSREAWDTVAKWRLDGTGHFVLIGYTVTSYDTLSPNGEMERGEVESKDANLATLQMVEKISGRKAPLKCRLDPRYRGIELSTFAFEDFDVDDCGKRSKGK